MDSRQRGRPRKVPLPNISAAGKSDKKAESNADHSKSRGRGSGRGPRGRGRGAAHGRSGRNNVVQTDVVFTAGLSEQEFGRTKKAEVTREEKVVGMLQKTEPTVHGNVKNEACDDVKVKSESTLPTYDDEWLSDDELDKEELNEIIKSSFISDVRSVHTAPVVLPSRENSQFHTLVKTKSSTEVDEAIASPRTEQSMKPEASEVASEAYFERLSDQGTAEISDLLQECVKGTARDFLLLQLPASLANFSSDEGCSHLPDQPKSEDVEQNVVKSEVALDSENKDCPTSVRHVLDGLPSNVEVGKMQVLRDGRVRLLIGGRPMEVHPAIPSCLNEVIVNMQLCDNTSNLNLLGGISHSVLCSYNYNKLLNRRRPPS